MVFTFLRIVTLWSRSTSNSYALIGQNLTGEFMRKIHASWNLFASTTDGSWQSFVSTCDVFNNCLFSLDVQNENTAATKSLLLTLFMAGLFIEFLVEKCAELSLYLYLYSWSRAQLMRLVYARLYLDFRHWSDLVWGSHKLTELWKAFSGYFTANKKKTVPKNI